MRSAAPLPSHPELTITHCAAWSEYKVQSSHVRGRASPSVQTLCQWFWFDAVVCLGIALLWPFLPENKALVGGIIAAIILYAYSRCTQVLWESVIILHSLGLQLETHRGIPPIPLFTSRKFISLPTLRDFVINEGLRGWSVHFYLAIIEECPTGRVAINVPFENIMPRFPVLLEVYHGVHDLLSGSGRAQDSTTQPCKK